MPSDCLLSLSCLFNIVLAIAFAIGWRTLRRRLDTVENCVALMAKEGGFIETDTLPLPVMETTVTETETTEAIATETTPLSLARPPKAERSQVPGPHARSTDELTGVGKPIQEERVPSVPSHTLESATDVAKQPVENERTDAAARRPESLPTPRQFHPLVEWFINMHIMVQVGIVVLFFGVGFLVKYAAEQGWFPLEVRLASAALMGVALAVVGWRLRHRRRTYGLALIGGGIGIVYLTTFGAYFFYGLLPALFAFTIFVTLSLVYVLMALLNDAQILAFLAILGAFLAPWLASDGAGSHLVLFSYYAVVNCGVLAIARYKHWSTLNVASFGLSALAATAWASGAYQPIYFVSTAIFLALFFLFYLMITLWQALRPLLSAESNLTVGDVIVLFANPVVSFLLAAALLQPYDGWTAYCALLLTGIYGVVSFLLRRHITTAARFVADSSYFFAAFFLTIAIPLRFDAGVTAAIWSVMGVGLVWFSLRRDQTLLRWWGVLVHLLAMMAFVFQLDSLATLQGLPPYLNHFYLNTFILSITTLTSAALLQRARPSNAKNHRPIATMLLIFGLLWWYGGGLAQFPLYAERIDRLALLLLYLIISGFLADGIGLWLRWDAMRLPMLTVLPSALLIVIDMVVWQQHPFDLGWYAWPALLAAHLWMLHSWSRRRWLAIFHAVGVWLATFLLGWRLVEQVALYEMGNSWIAIALLAVPLIALFLLGPLSGYLPWPVAGNRRSYVGVAATPIAIFLLLVATITAIAGNGDSDPLPFLPLLNPLDSGLFLTIIVLWQWVHRLCGMVAAQTGRRIQYLANWLLAVLTLLVLNGALARSVHHLLGIPYTFPALFSSAILQMGYALLWATLAFTFMFIAHRRRLHQLWTIGAGILGLTVLKLFLVDLAQTGTLTRIVSFIGVGLLIITIAYFWPAPPRKSALQNEDEPQ